jgi:hypothetical protein
LVVSRLQGIRPCTLDSDQLISPCTLSSELLCTPHTLGSELLCTPRKRVTRVTDHSL